MSSTASARVARNWGVSEVLMVVPMTFVWFWLRCGFSVDLVRRSLGSTLKRSKADDAPPNATTDRHKSPATSTITRLGEAGIAHPPSFDLSVCICIRYCEELGLPWNKPLAAFISRHITCYSSVDSSSPTLLLRLRLRARVRRTRIIQRSISAAVQLLNPTKAFIFFRDFPAARFRGPISSG